MAGYFGTLSACPGRIVLPLMPLAALSLETVVPLRLAIAARESPFFTV